MKYVVPIRGVEHLFDATELGLIRAKEFALASGSRVIFEQAGVPRRVVFPVKTIVKTKTK
jgi:hypothetical protein